MIDNQQFTIGENDGIIKVKSGVTLSYKDKKEHELVIIAKDSTDVSAKSASTSVKVQLLTGKFIHNFNS